MRVCTIDTVPCDSGFLTLRGLYIDESTKRFHEGSITGRR